MTETIETLRERMEAAAAALDFEEAKRLRDRISLMRGGATSDEAEQARRIGVGAAAAGRDGAGHQPATGGAPTGLEASAQAGSDDTRTQLAAPLKA